MRALLAEHEVYGKGQARTPLAIRARPCSASPSRWPPACHFGHHRHAWRPHGLTRLCCLWCRVQAVAARPLDEELNEAQADLQKKVSTFDAKRNGYSELQEWTEAAEALTPKIEAVEERWLALAERA